jgi:23S rRNA (cytidine1920-2'-O)/16S rRNA (cytidine1409-2'-O)-methyltransferase
MHIVLPEKADFISVDVSWTRQKFIIPSALKNLKEDGTIISLIKPHYEAEKFQLTKGKLEEKFEKEVVENTLAEIKKLGATVKNIAESPVLGQRGKNKEYLILIQPD